jgi:uncharacterized repeat protein (TIGR01451 family)
MQAVVKQRPRWGNPHRNSVVPHSESERLLDSTELMPRRVNHCLRFVGALLLMLGAPSAGWASNCFIATAPGTGAANAANLYQNICWLDFTSLVQTTVVSPAGQNFSYTTTEGTTLTFNMKVSGLTSPETITGASPASASFSTLGFQAYTGIGGNPLLEVNSGNQPDVVATLSNILLTAPDGTAITSFQMVAGDGESTNQSVVGNPATNETLSFNTNAGTWAQIDTLTPTTLGSSPVVTGLGTATVTETASGGGHAKAYIFATSTGPTTLVVHLGVNITSTQAVALGLVFTRLTLNKTIAAPGRISAADQFTYTIANSLGTVIGTQTSTGTTTTNGVSATPAVANIFSSGSLTLVEKMATGSVQPLSAYSTAYSCTNTVSPPAPPSGTGSSFNIVSLSPPLVTATSFGQRYTCAFTNTPLAKPTLQISKTSFTRTGAFTFPAGTNGVTAKTITTATSGMTVTNATIDTLTAFNTATNVVETVPAGYSASAVCNDTNSASSGNVNPLVTLAATTVSTTSTTATITIPAAAVIGRAVIKCDWTNQAPQLTVTKAASPSPMQIGQPAAYTIAVQNTGSASTAGNIVLAETLPAGLTVTNVSGTGWTCVGTTGTFSCTFTGTIAAGSSSSLVLTVLIGTTTAASITNTAVASGGGDVTCPAAARCAGSVTTAVSTPVPATCGQSFIETFGTGATASTFGPALPAGTTTYNYANSSATGSINGNYSIVPNPNLSDTADWVIGLDHTPADTNGNMLVINADVTAGTFYQRSFTGLTVGATYGFGAYIANICPVTDSACQILPNVNLNILDGLTNAVLKTLTTGAIADPPDKNTIQWLGFSSTFVATSTSIVLQLKNNAAGGNGNDLAIDDITFSQGCDLSVTKDDGKTTYTPGTTNTYTMVASNSGPGAVTGATIADTLPAAFVAASTTWACTASSGSACGTANGTGSISALVDLLSGGTATFVLTAPVSSSASGSLANTVTITPPASAPDGNAANNSATDTDTYAPISDLSIVKTDNASVYVPGTSGVYKMTVGNAGPSDVVGAKIADSLPAGMSLAGTITCVPAAACGSNTGTAPTISLLVNLAAGTSVVISVPVNYSSNPP